MRRSTLVPNQQVYVVFHGLWVFEVPETGDKIFAHTPYDEDHRVAAGFLDIQEHRDDSQTVHCEVQGANIKTILPGESKLIGVKRGSYSDRFDRAKNAFIDRGELTHRHLRYCTIELPQTEHIYSVRRIPRPDPKDLEHPFADRDGEKMYIEEVSMVQVFQYEIDGTPDIYPPGDVPVRPAGHETPAQLHVFAEPEITHRAFHGRIAYTRMAEMMGLKIVPIAELSTPPTDPGVPGMTKCDTIGLSDRINHSIFLGESGSNCDALVIDKSPRT
jgi:hypothetical protein